MFLAEYPMEIGIVVAAIVVLNIFVFGMDFIEKRTGLNSLQLAIADP